MKEIKTVEEWLGEDNQIGIDIWKKKYQRNGERFPEWVSRVAGGDKKVEKLIYEKKFLPGGRILSNRGIANEKVTYSNCYVIAPPEDNIESIYESRKKLARTYSYGGGCGLDISKLAPAGAKVRNQAKMTSGAVSFMDGYSKTTEEIGQNGRRGALMLSISCEHPDLIEFIKAKTQENSITKANISVRVTDSFMSAVHEDKDWELHFERPETGERITKVVKATDVFELLCRANWDWAEPGVLFWDKIEKWNLLSNMDGFHYAGVNPCVTGDTYVLTDSGYQKISEMVGRKIHIWNGYRFSEVEPMATGHNQDIVHIAFSDGSELKCTPYHKFILHGGKRVEARELNTGDKLEKFSFPIIGSGDCFSKKVAYTQGFFMGNGSTESSRNRLSIRLYGEKRALINHLEHTSCVYCPSFDGEFLTLPYEPDVYNKEFVPSVEWDIPSRLAWLAGYLDSDGTLQSKDGGISISSTSRETLMRVKHLLNTLGCNGTVSLMHEAMTKDMPINDGTGEMKACRCVDCYRLAISATNVSVLMRLGLATHRIKLCATPNRDASRFITVSDIHPCGKADTVYCFTEPFNHSGVFNGIMTGQCAEEPLPAGGSCLLGSINLAEFVFNPFTNNARFDSNSFIEAVRISTRALNDVLDEGLELHPLEEQRKSVETWRQIGLGIFGLADMYIKLGIRYGDTKAITYADYIGKMMINAALQESASIAREKGTFPAYDADAITSSAFFKENANPDTVRLVKENGLRNSQILTIAPTGTISTMLGVSGGVEPIFANYYTRKTESLHGKDVCYKVYTPIVAAYMKANMLTEDAELPDYFVTAQTIDPEERIAMQAAWQSHIDASISSTVNLPNNATVEDVNRIYMSAWLSGLKGITIFREGCKRAGILTTNTTENNDHVETYELLKRGDIVQCSDDLVGKKRKLTTGCGSLHCLAYFDPVDGSLQEVYLSKGSTGGCANLMTGLSRTISLLCRAGVDVYTIKDQLDSTGACPSYATRSATKHDTSSGSCCPMAVGNAIVSMYEEMQDDISDGESGEVEQATNASNDNNCDMNNNIQHAICPECGGDLRFEGGCNSCASCGFSRCG